VTEAPRASRRRPPLGAHIVLVGLPGAGKSTVGQLAADLLGVPFLDFDAELERREGMPVSEIFLVRGERYFRRLERELTAEVRRKPPMLLAPGGGWMIDPANVALVRPPSRIIHLRVGVEAALSRLGPDRALRPLLTGDEPQERLAGLSKARTPVYETADAEIDTQPLVPQEVASAVGELATHWAWPIG
jgi:shikimate kinase